MPKFKHAEVHNGISFGHKICFAAHFFLCFENDESIPFIAAGTWSTLKCGFLDNNNYQQLFFITDKLWISYPECLSKVFILEISCGYYLFPILIISLFQLCQYV